MHRHRNKISSHIHTISMSQSAMRRRSLDNLLGNMISCDERTREEIVRENLRQVIIKHSDWDSYLANNSDYQTFISKWSCHWWCSLSICSNRMRERHFLQSLDEHFQCALHYAVRYNNLRVCQSLIENFRLDVNIQGIHGETVLHMYANRQKWPNTDCGDQILQLLCSTKPKININALDDEYQTPVREIFEIFDVELFYFIAALCC